MCKCKWVFEVVIESLHHCVYNLIVYRLEIQFLGNAHMIIKSSFSFFANPYIKRWGKDVSDKNKKLKQYVNVSELLRFSLNLFIFINITRLLIEDSIFRRC